MDMPHISQRGIQTPESPIRKLAPYADAAKSNGKHIFHLNIGQPDIPTPREFYDAIKEFENPVLAYGPSNGMPSFRNSMLNYYHRKGYNHIENNDIMVTTAGSESVLFSMLAVTSPGDEIIVFEPFYPNYNGFAHMAGITLTPVPTAPDTEYHLPKYRQVPRRLKALPRSWPDMAVNTAQLR